jgi:hypothetical protein
MPPWLKRTGQSIPDREEKYDQETASTSGKEEDILRRRGADPGTGDYQISSQVFHRATGTWGRITVEMSAPAEAEEIVP